MISDFLAGLGSYGKALSLTARLGLWKYWLLPGLIGFVIGIGSFSAAWFGGAGVGSQLVDWYPWDRGAEFFSRAAPWLTRILILIFTMLVFKHILLVVVSPFMSMLSEQVEAHYVDVQPRPFSWSRAGREMIRGLRIALRNLWRELLIVLLLTLLSFFGPLAIVTGTLIFLVQAYYAGFGNFDFSLERKFTVRETVRFVRSSRGSATANGLVFLLLISTVVGILVAPAWSTIAAAIEVERIQAKQHGLY